MITNKKVKGVRRKEGRKATEGEREGIMGTTEWTMNLEVIKQKKLGAGKEKRTKGKGDYCRKGKSYERKCGFWVRQRLGVIVKNCEDVAARNRKESGEI